jgi:antitoxin component YwqK of YwqJK toxin-antitoxin module
VAKATKKKSKREEHIHYHKDGSVWAKGELREGVMCGYWEWFRKDGTKLRSGYFDNDGEQVGEWTTYDSKGKVYKVTEKKATK